MIRILFIIIYVTSIFISFSKRSHFDSKARSVKAELEKGLDLWRVKVLKVQSQSIMKAEKRLQKEIKEKKERLINERRKKEKKIKILKKQKIQNQRKALKKTERLVEEKNAKVRYHNQQFL